MLTIHGLYVDKSLVPFKKRPNFNELLNFYPVTRRAWKRALIQRDEELRIMKSQLENNEA